MLSDMYDAALRSRRGILQAQVAGSMRPCLMRTVSDMRSCLQSTKAYLPVHAVGSLEAFRMGMHPEVGVLLHDDITCSPLWLQKGHLRFHIQL